MTKLDVCRDILWTDDHEVFAICTQWGEHGEHGGVHRGPSLHERGVVVMWEREL